VKDEVVKTHRYEPENNGECEFGEETEVFVMKETA